MTMCCCYYADEIVHTFILTERDLADRAGNRHDMKTYLLARLRNERPGLELPDQARFDYVFQLKSAPGGSAA